MGIMKHQGPQDCVDLADVYQRYGERDLGAWLRQRLPQGGKLLDLGTGPGHLLVRYVEQFQEACYSDLDWQMLDLTAKRMLEMKLHNRTWGFLGDFNEGLPPGGPWDVVVGCFIAPFVKNWSEFALQVQKELAPGGRLVLVDVSKRLFTESRHWNEAACDGWLPHVDGPTWGHLPHVAGVLGQLFRETRHSVFENVLTFPTVEEFLVYYRLTTSYRMSQDRFPDFEARLREVVTEDCGEGPVVDHKYLDVLECLL